MSGDHINTYKYLKDGHREDVASLFLVGSSKRTRGNGHKLEYSKFRMDTRNNFFAVSVTENCSRLPREVVGSPSLEKVKTLLDATCAT